LGRGKIVGEEIGQGVEAPPPPPETSDVGGITTITTLIVNVLIGNFNLFKDA
jgi:hypothetical protein